MRKIFPWFAILLILGAVWLLGRKQTEPVESGGQPPASVAAVQDVPRPALAAPAAPPVEAVAPEERLPIPEPPAPWRFTFVDALDRTPLRPEAIELLREDGSLVAEPADGERVGHSWTHTPGQAGGIVVRAPSFLPVLVAWPEAEQGRDVEVDLVPCSGFEVDLVVDEGARLPEEETARQLHFVWPPEVFLLRPGPSPEDRDGLLLLAEELLRGGDPAWRPLGPVVRDLTLHEGPQAAGRLPVAAGYSWSSLLPLLASGGTAWFDVHRGESARLELRMTGAGTLRGRLDLDLLPEAPTIALVRLYRLERSEGVARFRTRAETNAAGEFAFADLPAGEYRVDGLWQAGDTWCIAARLAELGGGWGVDLGLVSPAPSEPVRFRPYFAKPDGGEIALDPGPPSRWPEFSLAAMRGFPDPMAYYLGAMPLPLGRWSTILGMETGRWNFHAFMKEEMSAFLPERSRFAKHSIDRSYELVESHDLELPIPVLVDCVPVTFRLRFPKRAIGLIYHWHVIAAGADVPLAQGSVHVREADIAFSCDLPRGSFQFVALPSSPQMVTPEDVLPSAFQEIVVDPAESEIAIALQPGVTLRGRYLSSPEESEQFRAVGFSVSECHGLEWNRYNCLGAVVDGQSLFVVHGVPRGCRIQDAFSDQTWQIGEGPFQEIEVIATIRGAASPGR